MVPIAFMNKRLNSILIILVLLNLLIGCVSEADLEEKKRLADLVVESNKHVDTWNDDTLKMNGIMGKYNLKSISIDERIDVVNEYINYYNIRINHLNDFYNFIVNNEQDLKDEGVDTFKWKKDIKDTIAIHKNNIEGMKNDVDQIINYEEELRRLQNQQQLTQQQYDEYHDLLKILGALLI